MANLKKYFVEIIKIRKAYGGMEVELHTFVNLAPDGGGWSLLCRFTSRVRSVGCIKGCVVVTTGLGSQAVEITEVHTPADII
jgi:hypothetical protein